MLNLVLSLALLGAPEVSPPVPATAIGLTVMPPGASAQGYEDWWIALLFGKDKRRRHHPTEAQQNPGPPGNMPAPGPLPVVLLGMGILGVGAAATSRRRRRRRAGRGNHGHAE